MGVRRLAEQDLSHFDTHSHCLAMTANIFFRKVVLELIKGVETQAIIVKESVQSSTIFQVQLKIELNKYEAPMTVFEATDRC